MLGIAKSTNVSTTDWPTDNQHKNEIKNHKRTSYKQDNLGLTTWYCRIRGDKIPMVRGKGENTPLPNNVDKQSVNDAGPQQSHKKVITTKQPDHLFVIGSKFLMNIKTFFFRFHFMDGQFHAIEFDPSATATEVLKLVKAKIGLRDNAQGIH